MSGSNYFIKDNMDSMGSVDFSLANTITFASGRPIDVKKIVLVTTVAHTVADATITVGVRNVDNTASVTKGTFVLPFTGSALNQVKYVNLVKPKTTATTQTDGSIYYSGNNPGGFIRVKPGQKLFLTSAGGGSTGTYQVYVEYEDQGFSGPDVSVAVEQTFTPV